MALRLWFVFARSDVALVGLAFVSSRGVMVLAGWGRVLWELARPFHRPIRVHLGLVF